MLYHYKARIIKVYDADTIRADIDCGFGIWNMNQPLRLARINAPEIAGDTRERGLVARDFLRDLILDKIIMIETIKDRKEKYGRYLAELWIEGANVNDWLVSYGMAVYVEY